MPGYLKKAFIRFKHETPNKIQRSPHPHAKEDDVSPPLSADDTKFVQAVAGTLLYYAGAVDATILTALSSIATEPSKPKRRSKQWRK
jgi:hypothetical protein